MAKNEKPWEPLDGESAKAYAAFSEYRDMGSQRSLREVAKKLGKSETLIARWSGQWDWVKRALAWDTEMDRQAREEQAKEIVKMRKRHAKLAVAMLDKAEAALGQLKDYEMDAQDISRMADIASKLERLSRGDVGEVIEERDGGETIPMVQFYMPDNHRNDEPKEEEEKP